MEHEIDLVAKPELDSSNLSYYNDALAALIGMQSIAHTASCVDLGGTCKICRPTQSSLTASSETGRNESWMSLWQQKGF